LAEIGIVIAAWNVRDHLRVCLKSIEAETQRHAFRVIVVDNGSTDGTSEMIAAEFPKTTVLRNDANLGFVAGTNRGLRRTLEERDDYILLLNADIIVRGQALDRLADFLDAHPEAGGVSPGLKLPNGSPQTGPGGFAPSARSAWSYFLFVSKFRPRRSRPLFVDARAVPADGRRVDWLSGACLMVRADVVRKVGLMDESYFLYADDIDWGVRMTRAGSSLYFLPSVEVVHFHGVTSKTIHREINTRWLERLFQFVRTDRGAFEAFIFRLIAACGFALRALAYSLGFSGAKAREMAAFAAYSLSAKSKS
jgi:hypothetical protein